MEVRLTDSHSGFHDSKTGPDPEPLAALQLDGGSRAIYRSSWTPSMIKYSEEQVKQDTRWKNEILPVAGFNDFLKASQNLIFHEHRSALQEGRIVSLQTVAGTGATSLGASLLKRWRWTASLQCPTVYLSCPTWPYHCQIFEVAGLLTDTYSYLATSAGTLDLDAMIESLEAAPRGSVVALQACAHNPTGVDPTREQWKKIATIMEQRSLFPFFDCALQGLASGSLCDDAWAIRYFCDQGFSMIVAQSYTKTFGLGTERLGCLHFVCSPTSQERGSSSTAKKQLETLQKLSIASPPAYGARLAAYLLNDSTMMEKCERNIVDRTRHLRIIRQGLRERLDALDTPGNWSKITQQTGLFCYLDFDDWQIRRLNEEHFINMSNTGRISIEGLDLHDLDHLASAIDDVTRNSLRNKRFEAERAEASSTITW